MSAAEGNSIHKLQERKGPNFDGRHVGTDAASAEIPRPARGLVSARAGLHEKVRMRVSVRCQCHVRKATPNQEQEINRHLLCISVRACEGKTR